MRRNRDFGNNKPNNGPLMTNHLRDLDIELKLLKRKREIIQREQNMLSRLSRQNNYEQPSNSFRHETNQFPPQQVDMSNFANLYEGAGGSRGFRQQGFKRQSQSNWQGPNPPKRFNAPRGVIPWQDDMMAQTPRKAFPSPKQRFPQPVPLMSVQPGISQRNKKDNRQSQRRDFQSNKVTKPAQTKANPKDFQSQPNPQPEVNIVNYTPEEAKKIVSDTLKALEPKIEDQILYADKQPSLQMKGRMELALGSILKEMRQDYITDPDLSEYFVTHFIQRIIKQTIRLRIRDVMMGKVVGAVSDILVNYRKTYPKETDVEIMTVVRDAQAYTSKNLSVTHLIESDDPHDFFRRNMMRVLSIKLDDIFSNLQIFYENKDAEIIESINKLPDPESLNTSDHVDDTSEVVKKPCQAIEKSNLYQVLNNFFESVPENSDIVKALGGRIDKARHYIDFMDKVLDERLPKALPKFKDAILNILYNDKEYFCTKALIMSEMKKKVKDVIQNELAQQKDNEETKLTEEINKGSVTVEGDVRSMETADEEGAPASITTTIINEEPAPGYTDTPTTNTATATTAVNEAPAAVDKPPTSTTAKTTDKEPLYYVKLVGRPALPDRAVIYEFLNQFNAKTIKKHKNITNLLVLTFVNKDDFDRILAANETVVGDATIIVKAGEQATAHREAAADKNPVEDKSNSSHDSSLISSDLDKQISDLLLSIKNTEEDLEERREGSDEGKNRIDEVEYVGSYMLEDADAGNDEGNTQKQPPTETVRGKATEDVEIVEDQPDTVRSDKMDAQVYGIDDGNVADEESEMKMDEQNVDESTSTSYRSPNTSSSVRTRSSNRLAQNNP